MARKFANWLTARMQERDWSQSDLARASGIHKQSVHYYLTKSVKPPHAHALSKIANALELPVEEVYRAAAHVPHPPELNEIIEEIVYEMEDMPKKDQQEILAFVRMKNDLRQQEKKK